MAIFDNLRFPDCTIILGYFLIKCLLIFFWVQYCVTSGNDVLIYANDTHNLAMIDQFIGMLF